ncbi:MAG TPA: hypothetical protein ENJ26_00735 [Rhodobacteraceae bacterium]|nr:hypothetical protein [Paracoccaceae bacterium]
MADAKQIQFRQRLQQIGRKHKKLEHGYVTTVLPDGLIVAKPQRKHPHHVMRSVFLCLIVMFAFKIFLYLEIGHQAYVARVAQLQSGSMLDKVGAYVMYPDPLTISLANVIRP